MKKLLLLCVSTCGAAVLFSQNVGIGTVSPNAAAMLEIASTQKGLLIPRMTQADRNGISQPATSLLIYQIDGTPGFYYNAGAPASPVWTALLQGGGGNASSWLLAGNSGTDSLNNFLGTIDDRPLLFRVNNVQAGKLERWNANTSLGYQAGQSFTTGKNNLAIGYNALPNTNTGGDNVSVGNFSLMNNQNGNGNIAIGGQTLRNNVNGVVNICIGYGAEVAAQNYSNAAAIGWSVIVNSSNKVIIGTNTTGMVVGGYVDWSTLSDGRFKENIQENVPGLSFITKLRPVTYSINSQLLDEHIMKGFSAAMKAEKMKQPEEYARSLQTIRTGFIAQEVEQAASSIHYTFDGVNKPTNPRDTYSVAYASFVVPIVKAIQEQQGMIENQAAEIKELKERLRVVERSVSK